MPSKQTHLLREIHRKHLIVGQSLKFRTIPSNRLVDLSHKPIYRIPPSTRDSLPQPRGIKSLLNAFKMNSCDIGIIVPNVLHNLLDNEHLQRFEPDKHPAEII